MKLLLKTGEEIEMSISGPLVGYRVKHVLLSARDMHRLTDLSPEELRNWIMEVSKRFPPPGVL